MALAERLQLRRQAALGQLAAQGVVAERQQEEANGDGENDDGDRDGQAAGQRDQGGGQVGDNVVGGVHGDAEDSGHDKPSSGPGRLVGCWRRPRSRTTRRSRFLLLSSKSGSELGCGLELKRARARARATADQRRGSSYSEPAPELGLQRASART